MPIAQTRGRNSGRSSRSAGGGVEECVTKMSAVKLDAFNEEQQQSRQSSRQGGGMEGGAGMGGRGRDASSEQSGEMAGESGMTSSRPRRR
jgi:hypothetical protein